MLPTPSVLESAAAALNSQPGTITQRLLGFFDTGLFRFAAFVALTPILLRGLGEAQFGMIGVAAALTGYLSIAQRGVQEETTRLCAAALRAGDAERAREALASALVLLGGLGVIAGGALAVTSVEIAQLFGADADLLPACSLFLALQAAKMLLLQPISAYTAAGEAGGRLAQLQAMRGMGTLLQVAAAFGAIGWNLGLPGLAALDLAGTAVVVLSARRAGLAALRDPKSQSSPGITVRSARRATIAQLAAAGVLLGANGPGLLAAFDAGLLVVAAVLGLHAVAPFAIAVHGCRLLIGSGLYLAGGLYPTFATLALHGERLQMRWVFRRAMDATLLTASGLSLLVIAFGRPVMAVWLDLKLPPWTATALGLCVLTAAPVVVAGRYVARAGLETVVLGVTALECAVAVGLSLWLIGEYGIAGVAIGVAAAQVLTSFWLLPHVGCRHLRIVPARFWFARYWRTAVVIAPAIASTGMFALARPPNTSRDLVVQIGIAVILHSVAAFAAWYLLETRPEMDAE